jgi:hypothetical protein
MNDSKFDNINDKSRHNIYKSSGYFTSTPGFFPSLAHPTDNVYVRDSCLANEKFKVDPEKPSAFQRKHYLKNNEKVDNNFSTTSQGKFKSSDGEDKDVIIKTVLASNIDALYDFKYNAEAYSLIPDYISEIKMLDKCGIFSTNGTVQRDKLIVVVIENMKSFKQEIEDIYLKAADNAVTDVNKFSKLLDGLVKACDAFNNCGFFHKNLKYKNIGIGKKDRVVLTDFIEAGYIQDLKGSENLDKNPPLNSFYICVYLLKKITNQDKKIYSSWISNLMYTKQDKKIYPSWISHLMYTGSFYYTLIKKTLNFKDDNEMITFLQKNMPKITPEQLSEFLYGVKYYFQSNDTRFDSYPKPNPNVNKIIFEKNEKIDPNIDLINKYLKNNSQPNQIAVKTNFAFAKPNSAFAKTNSAFAKPIKKNKSKTSLIDQDEKPEPTEKRDKNKSQTRPIDPAESNRQDPTKQFNSNKDDDVIPTKTAQHPVNITLDNDPEPAVRPRAFKCQPILNPDILENSENESESDIYESDRVVNENEKQDPTKFNSNKDDDVIPTTAQHPVNITLDNDPDPSVRPRAFNRHPILNPDILENSENESESDIYESDIVVHENGPTTVNNSQDMQNTIQDSGNSISSNNQIDASTNDDQTVNSKKKKAIPLKSMTPNSPIGSSTLPKNNTDPDKGRPTPVNQIKNSSSTSPGSPLDPDSVDTGQKTLSGDSTKIKSGIDNTDKINSTPDENLQGGINSPSGKKTGDQGGDKEKESEDKKSEDKKSEDKKSEDKKSEAKKSEDKKSEAKKSEDKKSEDKKSEDKKSEDKKSEDKKSEAKKSEDKKSEAKKSEDKKSEDKKSEDKKSEDKKSEDKKSEDKKSEVKQPEAKKSDAKQPEDKKSEAKKSEAKKSEDKKSEDKKSEAKKSEDKKSEAKKSEDKKSEDKKSEDKKSEAKKSEAKKSPAKQPEAKKPEAKKSDAKQPEDKKSEAKKSEAKKSEDKKSEDKKSEAKKSEDKKSEAKKSEDKKSEDKKSEDKKSEDKKSEAKKSEAKKSPAKQPEAKKPEAKKSEDKKLESKKSPSKQPEAKKSPAKQPEDKKSEAKKSPAKKSEDKKSEDKKSEDKKSEAKKSPAKQPEAKKSEVKKSEAKKSEEGANPVLSPTKEKPRTVTQSLVGKKKVGIADKTKSDSTGNPPVGSPSKKVSGKVATTLGNISSSKLPVSDSGNSSSQGSSPSPSRGSSSRNSSSQGSSPSPSRGSSSRNSSSQGSSPSPSRTSSSQGSSPSPSRGSSSRNSSSQGSSSSPSRGSSSRNSSSQGSSSRTSSSRGSSPSPSRGSSSRNSSSKGSSRSSGNNKNTKGNAKSSKSPAGATNKKKK